MFDWIFDLLSSEPQAYFILFAVCAGDAVFPALPSESALILAGVLSVIRDLNIEVVVTTAALGAFIGDNTSYAIGRFVGHPAQKRFLDGERGRRNLRWASNQLDRRGGLLILVARFIPGGRTVTTFTCGLTHFSYPTFAGFAALAAVMWALYGGLLGYFGGQVFHDRPWLALLVAFGIAFGLTVVVESFRRVRERA